MKSQKPKSKTVRTRRQANSAPPAPTASPVPPPSDGDLSQELRELGELFKRAVKVARENPHVRDFESKITHAVSDLGARIDSAAQSAKEPLKNVGAQVKHAAQTYKESGAPEDFARGIAKSVRIVNERIRRAVEEMEKNAEKNA